MDVSNELKDTDCGDILKTAFRALPMFSEMKREERFSAGTCDESNYSIIGALRTLNGLVS